MNPELGKGLKFGSILWAIGVILTLAVHLIFGWKYPHAPPASSLVVFTTIIVGLFRLCTNIHNIFFQLRPERNKGELIVHVLAFGIVTILFISIIGA